MSLPDILFVKRHHKSHWQFLFAGELLFSLTFQIQTAYFIIVQKRTDHPILDAEYILHPFISIFF